MHEITFDGVKKYRNEALVLRDVSFHVNEGERVGMIGENGSGKSTVLKLIAGILKLKHCPGYPYAPVPPGYDEGWVKISKGTVCSYLDQIPQYPENMKVIDVLNSSFSEVYRIEANLRELEKAMTLLDGTELKRNLEKYSELMSSYEIAGGYETEEKLSRICTGLKFDERFLNQAFHLLSGGEKTTVMLGKLLVDTPDVLLLDEPTNHLDMESVEWLEDYVKKYKGTVIVVSHDRYFLDHVATKIIELENKRAETYMGNYSDYLAQKTENLRIQMNHYKEQKKRIDHMEQSIKELRQWAEKADNNKYFRRAASMQIKLDKMEMLEKPGLNKSGMRLDINRSERSGDLVIKAISLSKTFENKPIFKDAELLVRYGERVALMGSNGSGKTTFLKMLLGEIAQDHGVVSFGESVKLAYMPQNIHFGDEEKTMLEYFCQDIQILEGKAREHLAKFMFYGGSVFKKIKHLSGGERARLKLAKLLYQDINLLVLDEPTNHLDIKSIESMEAALQSFKGSLFLISHDRYFVNRICERIINIEDLSFKNYLGNYDYFKYVKEQQALKGLYDGSEKLQEKATGDKRVRNAGTTKKHHECREENDVFTIEEKAASIENQIKELEYSMEIENLDFEELNTLYVKKEELNRKLDSLLEAWVGNLE